MNRIIILGVALILCSSWTVLAQTEPNPVVEAIKNVEDKKSMDNSASIKNKAMEKSRQLCKKMVEELKKPYNPTSNNLLIRQYEDFDNQFPTNDDFTSEYKCDDFISSAYYELPLLKDYKKYTDQFATIVKRIQGPLSTYDLDLNTYIKETNNLLNTLLNKGVYQSKKSSIVFEYAPIFKSRNDEASILFLNNQIEELQRIIKNGKDATDMNAQLAAILKGLYDDVPAVMNINSQKKQEENENEVENVNDLKDEEEMVTDPLLSNINVTGTQTEEPSENQNEPTPGDVESSTDKPKVDEITLDDFTKNCMDKPTQLTNKLIDKKAFGEAYKVFEKSMKDLKKDVDAGKILNSNDLSVRLSVIYSTFLDSLEH